MLTALILSSGMAAQAAADGSDEQSSIQPPSAIDTANETGSAVVAQDEACCSVNLTNLPVENVPETSIAQTPAINAPVSKQNSANSVVTSKSPGYVKASTDAKDHVKWKQEVEVSTRGYNELHMDESFSQIIFPKEADLYEQPISVNDNKTLMIRFRAGARPFTGYVVFDSGLSTQVRFTPKDIPEQVLSIRGGIIRNPELSSRPTDEWIADTYLTVVEGGIPDDFSLSSRKALRAKIGPIIATPIRILEGGQYLIREYRLTSDKLIPVAPSDFYRPNVIASTIETDVVSPQHSPRLIVLEKKDE
jgi:hypothetical protein